MSDFTDNKIPILSFYSGGGFMDMGFEMAGFEIVWTNEYDKTFAELHSSGISSWRKSRGNDAGAKILSTNSIIEISSQTILAEAFPNGKPDLFGIIGGPPCQDFTIQGNMDGFDGSRGKLTEIFFDRILDLKPSFFVMENVTGLIKNKSTRSYLNELLSILRTEYYVDDKVLNALEFGVAQHRERVFFVGVSRKYAEAKNLEITKERKWFQWPENEEKYKNAEKKYIWPKTSAFGILLSKPNNVPIELCVESCLVSEAEFDKVPNSKEYFNMYKPEGTLSNIMEGETNRPSFKRLHRFRYSPTACYGNNEVHLHPYQHRRLSVREALRIQGVPDTYILPGKIPLSKKFKMIGNGVPVPMAMAMAKAVIQYIRLDAVALRICSTY